MAEPTKVLRCTQCGTVNMFELPTREVIKKEPCRCGVTETARIVRGVAFGVSMFFLACFGGCWASHHYETERVRIMQDHYELKNKSNATPFNALSPDVQVEPKRPLPKERPLPKPQPKEKPKDAKSTAPPK
jgi:hypothetical protein